MSLPIFSFIFAMWVLIIIGGGLMVLFIGPLSFSGFGELDPLVNSGAKVIIAMILIFIWVFALLKIKNWIFRKITKT
jgi:Mg/Co/Ni transporter MgtE|tara:strand:+ start:1455 stop:1685 length:231 start_codon:yes stop_codon:yes gene_type:complete